MEGQMVINMFQTMERMEPAMNVQFNTSPNWMKEHHRCNRQSNQWPSKVNTRSHQFGYQHQTTADTLSEASNSNVARCNSNRKDCT
ncbi:hypothetical protein PR048_023536 [Dryococelus australis]|uniref:Uncharacterized protein n=1 Tax=Dryococelus australis TaxID=614101 RepID=A0ABQ9GUD4_9NEOP|nr:hypothetical protein PR048_023536 [Dryococelus australis]